MNYVTYSYAGILVLLGWVVAMVVARQAIRRSQQHFAKPPQSVNDGIRERLHVLEEALRPFASAYDWWMHGVDTHKLRPHNRAMVSVLLDWKMVDHRLTDDQHELVMRYMRALAYDKGRRIVLWPHLQRASEAMVKVEPR